MFWTSIPIRLDWRSTYPVIVIVLSRYRHSIRCELVITTTRTPTHIRVQTSTLLSLAKVCQNLNKPGCLLEHETLPQPVAHKKASAARATWPFLII